jgi:hypothetical protein
MKLIYYGFLLFFISSISLMAQSEEMKGSFQCSQKKMNSFLPRLGEIQTTGLHSYDMLDYNLNLNIYSGFTEII